MKFCKDCQYYEKFNSLCQSPENPVDRVTGNPMQQRAHTSRYDESLCGEKAVFWIPGSYFKGKE